MNLSLNQLAVALGGEVASNQVRAPGPGHSPKDRSLAAWLAPGTLDGFTVHSHAGDDPLACKDYVRERLGMPRWAPNPSIPKHDPIANMQRRARAAKAEPITRTLEETFDMPDSVVTPLRRVRREHIYTLADGTPTRKVTVSYSPGGDKSVLQYGLAGDRWELKADKGPIVPYRLPDLLKYPVATIFIVEGEKDVETLEQLGHLATTNPMGAEKWSQQLNQYFVDRDVILIPDNDEAGERHIRKVYSNLDGVARSIKLLRLPDLPLKGDVSDWLSAGRSNDEFIHLANRAPDYKPREEPEHDEHRTDDPLKSKVFVPTPWKWTDPKDVSPREFLYGTHYIREFLSVGFGAPGGGKSTKRMVEAVAMASGRALLGVKPVKRLKVWYWNGEDPQTETDRRFAAICMFYGIRREEVEGWLFTDSGRNIPIVIAEQSKTGTTIATPVVEGLKDAIRAAGIEIFIADPFVSCHRVTENDNAAIDAVAKRFSDIAGAAGCAIDLEHHIRKTNGNEATVDDGRGASSLVGAARAIEVLNKMTKAEADVLGIEQHWRYLCVDDGKANMAPLGERKWFKMESVLLGNGTDLYPDGDSVGVVTKWTQPNHTANVTGADFDRCATAIRGGNWRKSDQSNDWVGNPIARTLEIDLDTKEGKAKVKALQKLWTGSGALYEAEEEDEKTRKKKVFIRVREGGD